MTGREVREVITITGSPKEIAALVDELQERRAEYERKSQVNRILEAFRTEISPQPGSTDQPFSLLTGKLSTHQEDGSGQMPNNSDQTEIACKYQPGFPEQRELPGAQEG